MARNQDHLVRSAGTRGAGLVRPVPVELLHPDGMARRWRVVGSNCPSRLLAGQMVEEEGYADFIILAPTMDECTPRLLAEIVQSATRQASTDGVIYVLAPPGHRGRISRLLREHGFEFDVAILHLPSWMSSKRFVPLMPGPMQYAFSKIMPVRRWKLHASLIALRLPGGQTLLRNLLPGIGLPAHRVGARPFYDWLIRLGCNLREPAAVIMSTSWRGPEGAVVLHVFSGASPEPQAVVKLPKIAASSDGSAREVALLTQLGPLARAAGVEVPFVLGAGSIGGRSVLVQTALTGCSLASWLPSHAEQLSDVLERVTRWLERWSQATMVTRPFDVERLDREILTPAQLLMPYLEQGAEYLRWLRMRATDALGVRVPYVATHNDLTMANVLVDEQGHLGVVDWEMSCEDGLPLVDFFYMVTDAVTLVTGDQDRVEAFKRCFVRDGAYRRLVTQLQQRLSEAVEVPPSILELCFHACWLHHAANEHHTRARVTPQPFREIVQCLARQKCDGNGGANSSNF